MIVKSSFNMCPTGEISAYIDGEIDTARESEMDAHFAGCEVCLRELNEQKLFLRHLDANLGYERDIELPVDFAKAIVANAESTVSGLRRPREIFNASFICAGLALFALFAMGADAGRLFQGLSVLVEQGAAVASFFGHMIYSIFVGIAIVIRAIAGQFRVDVATILAVAMVAAGFSLLVSRRALKTRRV